MESVSPVAACVQPLREERRRFGRAVRLVRGLSGDGAALRRVRVGARALPVVRADAASRDAPGSQPEVVAVAGGAGLRSASAGRFSSSSSSRNGPDLDGGNGLADLIVAAALHAGAGAQRGESSPCAEVVSGSQRHPVRALRPHRFRHLSTERASARALATGAPAAAGARPVRRGREPVAQAGERRREREDPAAAPRRALAGRHDRRPARSTPRHRRARAGPRRPARREADGTEPARGSVRPIHRGDAREVSAAARQSAVGNGFSAREN